MDKKQIENYLKEYIVRLKKELHSVKVIVYGSFIKGTYHEGSDIDLLVVSEQFKAMDDDERSKWLYRKTVGIPLDLHIYGFTEEELKKTSPLTSLSQALKEGVDAEKVISFS